MARVKDVRLEGTFLIIEYTDCTTKEINLCVECPEVPIEDNPGDWPDPIDNPNVRCRVAIKLGQIAAERLNDYLGLNLDITLPGVPETWTATKIGQYGWPIALYTDLVGFTYSLFNGLTAGRGKDANTQYDANPATVITNVQEALYCSLGEDGKIDEQSRGSWSMKLAALSGAFYDVLHDFIRGWPLEDLRELAFEASTTTDSVNCESFDCGASPAPCDFTETLFAVYDGADEGYWSTPPATYLGHTSRNFSTGTCILQLPSPVCITKIRVSHAGQSGTAWRKIQLFIDDVPYPIQNSKYHTSCNTNDSLSNFWLINPPIAGSQIKFVGTDLAPESTGNPNAPHVIHCARIDYGI